MTSNSRKDNKGVSPPNVGVRLSGTLSVPLSLHFVQTTPPIPYARTLQPSCYHPPYNNQKSTQKNLTKQA